MLVTLLAVALASSPAARSVPSDNPVVQVLHDALPSFDACVVGQTGALSFAFGTDKAGKVAVLRSVTKDVRDDVTPTSPPKPAPAGAPPIIDLNARISPQGPVLTPLTAARACFEAQLMRLQFAAGEPQGIDVDFVVHDGEVRTRYVGVHSVLGIPLGDGRQTRAIFAPLAACSSSPLRVVVNIAVAPTGKVTRLDVRPEPAVPADVAACLTKLGPTLAFAPTLATVPIVAELLLELGAIPHIAFTPAPPK